MDQFSGGYYHRQSYTSRSTTPIRQQPQMNQYPQRRDRSRPRDYVMSNRPSQYQTQQKPYPPPPRQRNPSPYRRAPPPGKFSRNPGQSQPSYNSYNQGQPYQGQSYEKRQSYSPTPSRNQIFQQFRGRQEKEQRTAVEREESYNIRFMKEREAEIQDINSKVKKVNEIYADLAGLIDGQQDLIDQVDMAIEEANAHTKEGVTNYEQARLVFENPISEDLFGDKIGRDRPKTVHIKSREFKVLVKDSSTHQKPKEEESNPVKLKSLSKTAPFAVDLKNMTSSFMNATFDIPKNTGIKSFRDIEKYYKQIGCVGHGGFASVFLAEKLSSEKEYAIKIFHNEVISDEYLLENRYRTTNSTTRDSNDEEEIEAFTRELAVLNKLRVNPNKDSRDLSIVYVKEYFQATNFAAIVMAYANGGTLAELIDKKGNEENFVPFSERRICWYALQLSEALSYAHERNIYHHDVKSSNVLIDRQEGGKLILTDWGSAIGEGEESFTISHLYASPELQSEYNRVSEQEESDNDTGNSGIIVEGDKVDAFGLGCIILELIYCQKLVNIAEENISDIISTKGVDAVLNLPSLRIPWLSGDTSHEGSTIGYSYEIHCFAKTLLELDPCIRYTPKEIAGPLRNDSKSPLLQPLVVAAETAIQGNAVTMDNIQLGMFVQFSCYDDDFDSEDDEEEADKGKIVHRDCIGVVVGLDPDSLYANCAFPTALFSFKLKSVRIGASKMYRTELKPRFEVIVGPSVDLQIDGYRSTVSGCISFKYLQHILGIEYASRLRMGYVINPKCVVVFLDVERDIVILAPTEKNKVFGASTQPSMFPIAPLQVDLVEKKSPATPQYWDTSDMKIIEETEPRQREIVTNLFFADGMDIQEYEILSMKRVQCNSLWTIFAKKSTSIASENFGNYNWQRLFLGTFDYDPESLLIHDPTSFFYPAVNCNGLILTDAFHAHRSRYEANKLNKIVLARAAVGKLSRDQSIKYHSKVINREVHLSEISQAFPEYIITYRRLEGAGVRSSTSTCRRVRTNQNVNLWNMMEAVTLSSRVPQTTNMFGSTASNIPPRISVALDRRSLKPAGTQPAALKQAENSKTAHNSIHPGSNLSPNKIKEIDEVSQKSSTKKCVICLEKDVRKLLLPCGHPCLCEVCGTEQGLRKLKHKCPECRAKVKTIVSFFGRVVND